jgi:cyclase
MLKKRIIPVILLRNGVIVQSRNFRRYQIIGNPTSAVERLSNWQSDELIYLDISPNNHYDLRRSDLNHPNFSSIIEIIQLVARYCRMPLTFGGGIRSVEDVYIRLKNGADKITLNTLAIENLSMVTEIAKKFGSQCVVISIDVKKDEEGKYFVYKRGIEKTPYTPTNFAKMVEDAGAGEILLNSVDLDGTGKGFDIELIAEVSNLVNIPIIALGGAGCWEHFYEVFQKTNASAAAAANIFHHSENSVYNCRKYLYERNIYVRKPYELSSLNKNL